MKLFKIFGSAGYHFCFRLPALEVFGVEHGEDRFWEK